MQTSWIAQVFIITIQNWLIPPSKVCLFTGREKIEDHDPGMSNFIKQSMAVYVNEDTETSETLNTRVDTKATPAETSNNIREFS